MLQEIHEKVHGWIAWLVIILIAITFALFGASYYIGSHRASDIKATVGHTQITKREFQDAYQRNKQSKAITSLAAEKKLKAETMRQLITNYSRVDAAAEEGFVVSKDQAQQAMLSIPQFLEDGAFSKERFQQILSANLYTPASFLTQIRQGMLLNQQRFLVAASNFALPTELDNFIALTQQSRDYRYAILGKDLFTKDVAVNDKEIKAYYDTHHNLFMTSEKVTLSYVEVSMPEIIKSIHFSDAELKTYYRDNQSSYVTPAQYKVKHIFIAEDNQKKLQTVVKELASDKSFSHIAKTHSDDLLATDGDMPWMSVGVLGSEADKALVKLKKGEVSTPIKTIKGYEILKLVDVKPMKQLSFDSVKDQMKQAMVTEKAQQLFSVMSDKLTDLSYQNPDSLDIVSKSLSLPIKNIGPVTRVGDKKGLLSNKGLLEAAFSDELLSQGENSQVLPIGDDAIVVIRVKSHLKPVLKSIKQVSADIKLVLVTEKALNKSKQVGNKLLVSLKQRQSIDNDLKAIGSSFVSEKGITRDNTRVNATVNHLAFSLNRPQGNESRLAGRYMPSLNAYVLVELKSVKAGKPSALDADARANTLKQLEASYGLRDYDLYLKSLMSNTKVEINS